MRVLLKKDPNFEISDDWPMVVEWCASCAISRTVRLVLPAEEAEVVEEETDVGKVRKKNKCCEVADVSTQTPTRKPNRRGGRGSKRRLSSTQ